MQMLPASGVDKTNFFQKVLAFIVMGGIGFGAIKLFNYIFPDIRAFFDNLWYMIAVGAPLLFLAYYVITNPLVVWGFFKTLSWKMTKWMIKQDPLSVMDRYVDYLVGKLNNLNLTIEKLTGSKIALERHVNKLRNDINHNSKKAAGANINDPQQRLVATQLANRVAVDQKSLKLFEPILVKMHNNLNFLENLSDNWKFSIDDLKYTIAGKRKEAEMLEETDKALKAAGEYAGEETDARKLYNESVEALEREVSDRIGRIDRFEKASKGITAQINVEKQSLQNEGLLAIEEFRKSGGLELPKWSANFSDTPQPVVVKSSLKAGSGNNQFNFLNEE